MTTNQHYPTLTRAMLAQPTPTSGIYHIPPPEAKAILDEAAPNRRISSQLVQTYQRDLLRNVWDLNGQTLKFDRYGRLIDGRHRLLAAIQANRTLTTFVALGLEPDVIHTVDTGRKRTLGDVLRIEQRSQYAALVSAALGTLFLLLRGGHFGEGGRARMSTQEALGVLDQFPHIDDSARATWKLPGKSPSTFCALHALLRRQPKQQVAAFFQRLQDGTMLHRQHPVYHLREQLLAVKTSRDFQDRKREMIILTLKAYAAFCKGEDTPRLTVKPREPIPGLGQLIEGLRVP